MQAYGSAAIRASTRTFHNQQYKLAAQAAAMPRSFYSTTQPPKQTAGDSNNETLQYLDRLKDSEIEFQSKGEHVSGDFWKTEPGKYNRAEKDVSIQKSFFFFWYICVLPKFALREKKIKVAKSSLSSRSTRRADKQNEPTAYAWILGKDDDGSSKQSYFYYGLSLSLALCLFVCLLLIHLCALYNTVYINPRPVSLLLAA
ncbi:hypothetical protein BDB00DRAFT_862615, partial [Zychaea mexicana]|uniref:uncharacterized protein n=1 Tax=Zychaea mexicana TaxID=64656 RepID=UPI0022FEBFA3